MCYLMEFDCQELKGLLTYLLTLLCTFFRELENEYELSSNQCAF